jgi:carbamoyl-phosphate synthase large subunit
VKEPVNILITAASRRVALIRSFTNALEKMKIKGNVIASDVDHLSAGLAFCRKHVIVPLSTSPDYITEIKKVCVNEDISLIIPTIDEELPLFGKYKPEFEELGVRILVSDEETGNICNDKYLTYNFLKKHGFPIAETWLPAEIRNSNPVFPLFIKPRFGRGAIDAYPVRNRKELNFFLDYVENPVVQKFLTGDEYTIDVLADFEGNIISVVPRQRLVIRAGVSDRGRMRNIPELIEVSKKIAEALNLVGPANLQCKIDRGKITFFEINPRFSGAIQLTIRSGADFPRMIVQMLNGGLTPRIGDFEADLTMVSYEESIYHSNSEKDDH